MRFLKKKDAIAKFKTYTTDNYSEVGRATTTTNIKLINTMAIMNKKHK